MIPWCAHVMRIGQDAVPCSLPQSRMRGDQTIRNPFTVSSVICISLSGFSPQ